MGNLKRKKDIIIVRISKREMEYLVSKGIKFGENGLVATTSHHKSYYVCESKRCMNLLKDFRNAITKPVK